MSSAAGLLAFHQVRRDMVDAGEMAGASEPNDSRHPEAQNKRKDGVMFEGTMGVIPDERMTGKRNSQPGTEGDRRVIASLASPSIRRYSLLFLLFLLLIAATRLPVMPGQLYSFDEVNMVYAMDKLDTRLSQPQPPGYPLFILEMRALRALRVVRPESNLIILALLGSAGAMAASVWCGDQIFGGYSGMYGALLLWLYPSFWYAGITSALRVQLALISLVVGGSCWRAWNGHRRWPLYSALALGLGAGIRPELGPLLFPLWAAGWIRSGASWKERVGAAGVLAAAVLSWLIPLTLSSGGFLPFLRHCLAYLRIQSATTSGLFGLEPTRWLTNTILLLVWTFSVWIFLPMLAVLARDAAERTDRLRWIFFSAWLGPSLLFAALVHVGDPGHTLAMVAPVCLFTGHEVQRAVSLRGQWRTPSWNWAYPVVIVALAPAGDRNSYRLVVILIALAAAIAARFAAKPNSTPISQVSAAGLVLLPVVVFFTHAFLAGGWSYVTLPQITPARLWSDVRYGFHLSSYPMVRQIVDPDDAAIRSARHLADEADGRTLIVSQGSVTTWRKVSYYLPKVRLLVLEKVREDRALSTEWIRSADKGRHAGSPPLVVSVPAGARLVWMVKPKSDFEAALRRSLQVTEAGPVSYTDLPATEGSRQIGDFLFVWTGTAQAASR